MGTLFNGLFKNATKIVAIAALAVTIAYTLLLLFLPATMIAVSGPFSVPESVGINRYLAKAITLTFGFLTTWLITKYMLGWNALNKKILAFAGLVGVWILYYFTMWFLTAGPMKKMSDLQRQIQVQQATLAQCGGRMTKLRAKVVEFGATRESCMAQVVQVQQALASEEQTLASKVQENEDLIAAGVQRAQELTQCRTDTETMRTHTKKKLGHMTAQHVAVELHQNSEHAQHEEVLHAQIMALEQMDKDKKDDARNHSRLRNPFPDAGSSEDNQ